VATGYYDKADAFLVSVPQGSGVQVPALFWRLKSAVMRADRSLASLLRKTAVLDGHGRVAGMDGHDPPQPDLQG
jgi:hypothetical protein